MTDPDHAGRRRALVSATAALTAVTILAGLGLIAVTSSPSLAQTTTAEVGSATPNALPLAVTSAEAASTDPTATGGGEPSTPEPLIASTTTLDAVTNVVFVLADDLDWNLFQEVPRLAALQEQGMTFMNHTVTDSLCCPSRTSILRGQYIHNHRVISNLSKTGGGWPTFRDRGAEADCLPVWLQSAGVTTALFGKYLNDYPDRPKAARYVPPGWNQWAVPISRGDSYSGYDYVLNDNGRLRSFGKKETDFLNDVITNKATDFIRTAPEGFFLELSTYNPHKPAPVAVRNKDTHLASVAPRTPSFNSYGLNEPSWLTSIEPITPWKQSKLDELWRKRAQSAESVADSVDAVLATLRETGRDANTLVVVTTDNGYHIGTHRLKKGKRTAFREDTVVPMVVIGPGVTPGSRIDAMTSTIDLAPTFTSILGSQAPNWVDGRNLTSIFASGAVPASWRNAIISESLGKSGPGDPDYQPQAPPSFTALRTPEYLFVTYRDGERELYDVQADPYEQNNIVKSADPRLVAALYSQMQALKSCAGDTCRTADAIPLPTPES